jgi:folate-binding protein YgfZ
MAENSPLQAIHERHGARFAELHGRLVPRNYGDAGAEYAAVRERAGVADRWDRALIRVYGRDPLRMIQGLITNDLAGAPSGQGVYAAFLTAKGKMVADLRAFRRPDGDIVLELDVGALENAMEHLRKFVPPLFARFEALETAGVLGVYGPASREMVERALGIQVPADLREEGFVTVDVDGGGALVARTLEYGEDGYDLILPTDALEGVWESLVEAGARPVGYAALDVLRIEAGRPRWGAELDESVIPLEAGLRDRAISQTKGCYTGQEVIIRILHRGHVNRHLRGVKLGDAPAPAAGTELFPPGGEKAVGRITSACHSPLHEQTIALAYVRREVEPPAELRLGAPDGAVARVFELPIPIES